VRGTGHLIGSPSDCQSLFLQILDFLKRKILGTNELQQDRTMVRSYVFEDFSIRADNGAAAKAMIQNQPEWK
jgi:hypothetical protein